MKVLEVKTTEYVFVRHDNGFIHGYVREDGDWYSAEGRFQVDDQQQELEDAYQGYMSEEVLKK